jgi:hypothetical protein
MPDTKTNDENEQRRQEFIANHVAHSKTPNDFHWKAAEALGAQGDYTPGDEGMHWSDIKENAY